MSVVLALAVLVALAVDRWLGEPPARWHPVVWMGHYLGWGGRWVQARTRQTLDGVADHQAFWLGALVWIAGAAIVFSSNDGSGMGGVAWSNRIGSSLSRTLTVDFSSIYIQLI